jgi:pre-mRNA-splicing factor ATP-dependent RNA helicase DHX15/PRP43
LLEYATTYFDLKALPDGEMKKALQRVANKRAEKSGKGDRPAKKQKMK